MKIKEQTRKLAAGCTWVRQGDVDVVWIWFSKSIKWFYCLYYTTRKEIKKLAVQDLLVPHDLDYHLNKFKEPIQYLKYYLVKQQLDCKRDDYPKEFHNTQNWFDKNNGKKSPEKLHFLSSGLMSHRAVSINLSAIKSFPKPTTAWSSFFIVFITFTPCMVKK